MGSMQTVGGVHTGGASTAMAKAMAMASSWNGLDTRFAAAMATAKVSSWNGSNGTQWRVFTLGGH